MTQAEFKAARMAEMAAGYLTLSADTPMMEQEESYLFIHRAADPAREKECGFRFQRCGGGVRVIRRQRGGAY